MDGDNFLVTQHVGEAWGRKKHRRLEIQKCANGFIVEFEVVARKQKGPEDPFADGTVREWAVFHLQEKLLAFIEDYFSEGKGDS